MPLEGSFPASLTVRAQYQEAISNTLDTRSDRDNRTRTWPDVNLGVSSVPIPSFLGGVIRRMSFSTGIRKQRQETSFGEEGAQRRFREDQQVPAQVSVSWGVPLTTTYSGSFTTGEGFDPTGDNTRSRVSHSLSISSIFTPPGDFGERLERPIRVILRYNYSAQSDCRLASGRESCVRFVDQLNRSLNMNVDTTIADIDVGFQLTFTDRQSFIGQQSGSTQFQIGFWGQFLFSSGQIN